MSNRCENCPEIQSACWIKRIAPGWVCTAIARASAEVAPWAADQGGATAAIERTISARARLLYICAGATGCPVASTPRTVPDVPSTEIEPIRFRSICCARFCRTRRVAVHQTAGCCVTNPFSSEGAGIVATANAARHPSASTAAARTPEVPTSMPRARSRIAGRTRCGDPSRMNGNQIQQQYRPLTRCHSYRRKPREFRFRKSPCQCPLRRASSPESDRSAPSSRGIAPQRAHVIECRLYCFLELSALHVLRRRGVVHRAPTLLDDRRQVIQIVRFDHPDHHQRNRLCNPFASRGAAGKFRCYEPIGGNPQCFLAIVLAERHALRRFDGERLH